jgi:hypothetical protein
MPASKAPQRRRLKKDHADVSTLEDAATELLKVAEEIDDHSSGVLLYRELLVSLATAVNSAVFAAWPDAWEEDE